MYLLTFIIENNFVVGMYFVVALWTNNGFESGFSWSYQILLIS